LGRKKAEGKKKKEIRVADKKKQKSRQELRGAAWGHRWGEKSEFGGYRVGKGFAINVESAFSSSRKLIPRSKLQLGEG